VVVLLSLLASAIVGVGDYIGGKGAERHDAIVVTLYAQAVNAIALPFVALLLGWDDLHPGDLLLGALAGACAGIAYLAFFHGLANGRMSVIAPLTALTTALVPVVFDIATGVVLAVGRWIGVALALVAIPLLAHRVDRADHDLSLGTQVLLGVGGGLGFAVFFVAIGATDRDSGQWPVAAAAVAATLAVLVVCAIRRIRLPRPPRLAVASGGCSVVAGPMIGTALQIGPVAVATVLGSLYPVVTSGLAVRFDREPLSRLNIGGIVVAVIGASMVAAF